MSSFEELQADVRKKFADLMYNKGYADGQSAPRSTYVVFNIGTYDARKIIGVEKGEWSDVQQDWRSILVFSRGARVNIQEWFKDVVQYLKEKT